MCFFACKKMELVDKDDLDKHVIPKIIETVRTEIIPDVIQRLNETSEMLERLEE